MSKKLYRSTSNKQLAGVCAGLGKYLNVDPTVIRILWVIISLFGFVPGLIAYIACVLIIPEEPPRIIDAE